MTIEQRIKRIEETVSGKKSLKEGIEINWRHRTNEDFPGVSTSVTESEEIDEIEDTSTTILNGFIKFTRCRSYGVEKVQFEKALERFLKDIGTDF